MKRIYLAQLIIDQKVYCGMPYTTLGAATSWVATNIMDETARAGHVKIFDYEEDKDEYKYITTINLY